MRPLQFFHTVRHLRPVQVFYRLYYRLPKPSPVGVAAPARRSTTGLWAPPAEHGMSLTGPATARFLNHETSIASAGAWNDDALPKLWLYNLHYFDDLTARNASHRQAWHRDLMRRWIVENPPGTGNGWEPYPISRRIVNWIKWALAGGQTEAVWLGSLATQTSFLSRRLEWHILGNHLFANAKALVFAGLFFEGAQADRWLSHGLEILARQIPQQILRDGGHFELSPMYHAILLEDLLDLLNVSRAFGLQDSRMSGWVEVVQRMRAWLLAMSHPDGEISFFNDAAFGIALRTSEIEAYSLRLGLPAAPLPASLVVMGDSGYVRAQRGDAVLIADIAAIGPDYLPGHAHADTLSFEFSLERERLIVNGGTSTYEMGAQRNYERSTMAHSTVAVEDRNSSDVWAAFRVGKRAHATLLETQNSTGAVVIRGSHDGYRGLAGAPVHQRVWELRDQALVVMDVVKGPIVNAVAHFHLGDGIRLDIAENGTQGALRTHSGRVVRWQSTTPARASSSRWHPEFGIGVITHSLSVTLCGNASRIQFEW